MKWLFIIFTLFFFNVELSAQKTQVISDSPVEYPGGYSELRKLIKEHFIYPQEAIDKDISGKCYVRFLIDKDGVCKDFIVKRGIPNCASCDEEALRLLKLMPKWKPAMQNGKPVETPFTIPVLFNFE